MILNSKIKSEQCEIKRYKIKKLFDQSFLLNFNYEMGVCFLDIWLDTWSLFMQKNLYVRSVRLKIQVPLIDQ